MGMIAASEPSLLVLLLTYELPMHTCMPGVSPPLPQEVPLGAGTASPWLAPGAYPWGRPLLAQTPCRRSAGVPVIQQVLRGYQVLALAHQLCYTGACSASVPSSHPVMPFHINSWAGRNSRCYLSLSQLLIELAPGCCSGL
jgi:hypothetical protein